MGRIVYGAICVLVVASATTAAMLKFQSQQGPQSQAESAAIPAERAAMEATTAAVQAAQTAQEAEPGKALWLTIRPEGFLPTEITVPAEAVLCRDSEPDGLGPVCNSGGTRDWRATARGTSRAIQTQVERFN